VGMQDRRQNPRAVAVAIGHVVVERRRAAVQPLGDDDSPLAERLLQDGRPAVLIGMTAGIFGVMPESKTIAVAEDGLHLLLFPICFLLHFLEKLWQFL
jgi:hypothetical protein